MVATVEHRRELLQQQERAFVLWFKEVGIEEVFLVSGKNSLLWQ